MLNGEKTEYAVILDQVAGEGDELREVENSKKEENNGLRGDRYLFDHKNR